MKKRVIALALALMLLMSISIPAFAAPTDEKTLRHTVARIYVGDMYSTNEVFQDNEWDPVACGTGFFVGKEGENPQYLITNQHVVDYYLKWNEGLRTNVVNQAGQLVAYARTQIRVYFEKDDYVEAYIVEVGDPAHAGDENISKHNKDFAILRLSEPTEKRAALPICVPNQSVSDPNRKVITVGFPTVADNELFKSISLTGEKDSHITSGMVNKIFTETGTGVQILEFDASINGGNSGGPLVLDNGAAIAVTTWSISGENEPMYYGVGMDTIKPYLDKNNIPYSLLEVNPEPVVETTPEPVPEEPVTPETPWKQYLIYGILAAAILGVVIVLIVLLRKPKPAASKGTMGATGYASGTVAKSAPPTNGNEGVTNPVRILVGVDGPLKDKRFTLEKGKSLYIGRDKAKCKVLFPDKTPGVSNIHCKISFDGKTATITDLKSSYGTTVNGNKLTPNTPTTLHRGLAIDIGDKRNRFTLQ